MQDFRFISDRRFGTVRVLPGATPLFCLGDIALMCGIDPHTVHKALKKGNVPIELYKCPAMANGGDMINNSVRVSFVDIDGAKHILGMNVYKDVYELREWLTSTVMQQCRQKRSTSAPQPLLPLKKHPILTKVDSVIKRSQEVLKKSEESHRDFVNSMMRLHRLQDTLLNNELYRIENQIID